jgi:MFS family permease
MRRYFVYTGLFLLMLINYIDRINLSIAAPLIAHHFGLSPVQMGLLFSSFIWTYVLFLLPMGVAVDRWGARGVAVASIAVWSFAGILTGASTSFVMLMFSRLLLGAGECVSFPAGGRVVREWAPRAERGIATAFLNSGAYVGGALGAVIVGGLVTAVGWRESFYVTGASGLLFALVWLIFYRRPNEARWLSTAERELITSQRENLEAPSRKQVGEAAPRRLSLLLRNPTMWALALAEGCATYTLYLFLSWMPTYLQAYVGANAMRMSLFTALPYVASALLVLALSRLSDRLLGRVSRRTMISLTLLGASTILLMPFATSIWEVVLLVSISLGCTATSLSLNITQGNDLLRDGNYAGMSVSFLIMGGNVFGLIAPVVTGYIVGKTGGYVGAFIVAGLLLWLGSFVSFVFTRRPIITDSPSERAIKVDGETAINGETARSV